MSNVLLKLDQLFTRFLNNFLTFVVCILIALSTYSIISRWLQLTNLWVDPLARHLVLLLIFLGATLAIDRKKHIRIDALILALDQKLSTKKLHYLELFINFMTMIVVFFLMKSSIIFWQSEMEFPVDAFLGLMQYHLVIIIPIGFFLMLLKYLFVMLISFSEIKKMSS